VADAQALTAPDGQQFESQSARTRGDFTATFGASCAQQEWVWQHSVVVDADNMLDGPPASDGQTLAAQDDDVQLAFVALFGPQATAEWNAEHNAVVAHHVLLGAVAPVPCPPARVTASPNAIGTTHLADAVNAAKNSDLGGAFIGFNAFKVIWAAAKPNVTKQSASAAQDVQSAVDQVNALLGDPKAPAPAQAQYYSALQNLLVVVRAANTAVAGGDRD
jgi:hypothetical protein